jgi:hypothetical protein
MLAGPRASPDDVIRFDTLADDVIEVDIELQTP